MEWDFLNKNPVREASEGIREQLEHQPRRESLPDMTDTFLRSFTTVPEIREVHKVHNVNELEFNNSN